MNPDLISLKPQFVCPSGWHNLATLILIPGLGHHLHSLSDWTGLTVYTSESRGWSVDMSWSARRGLFCFSLVCPAVHLTVNRTGFFNPNRKVVCLYPIVWRPWYQQSRNTIGFFPALDNFGN